MPVSSADADGPNSWLRSLSLCCAPLASCFGRESRRSKLTSFTTDSISWPMGRSSDQDLLIDQDDEKAPNAVVRQQPVLDHRCVPETLPAEPEKSRKSFASNRTMSTLKRRLRPDGSSHRPRISAPSDFRHLNTGSLPFPAAEPPRPRLRPNPPARRTSFRPLELSIYQPNNHMSPILPHFEFPGLVAPPPLAQLQSRLDDDHQLIRQRSNSSIPFHLPRKPPSDMTSLSMSTHDSVAPAIPSKSQARPRANTSPDLDNMKARVASAMIEVEKLQQQIEDVIERQSMYASSRPSTAHSLAWELSGMSSHVALSNSTLEEHWLTRGTEAEPMPSVPALPPAAPSFAERLHYDTERPQTAPLKTEFEIFNRSQEFGEGKTSVSSPTYVQRDDRPPPPPLPLVLRPPLRKKKSFSRVSTWLFPRGQHSRDMSLDSVTNLPRPVKGTEGFYQCVAPGEIGRGSFESVGTVSTWDSDEEQRTVPTTWSPGSTPVAKQGEGALERTATFGKNNIRPERACIRAAS